MSAKNHFTSTEDQVSAYLQELDKENRMPGTSDNKRNNDTNNYAMLQIFLKLTTVDKTNKSASAF